MFLSARSIAANRLAFSVARDSAHARKTEIKWQHRMEVFCKPFTTGIVRSFDRPAINQAREWLASA